MKNKKNILPIALLLVATIVGLVVFLFLTRATALEVSQSDVVARNLQFPKSHNQNIRFFTGSSFAEYNPENGETTSLTREFRFPRIDKVVWGDRSALVRTVAFTEEDELWPLINKRADLYDSIFWWYVDFENRRAYPLSQNAEFIKSVVVDDSNQVFFVRSASPNSYRLFACEDVRNSCRNATEIQSYSSFVDIVGQNSDQLFVTSPDGLLSVDKSSGENQVIHDHLVDTVSVSSDGKTIAFTEGHDHGVEAEGSQAVLQVHSLESGSTTKKGQSGVSHFSFNGDDLVLFYQNKLQVEFEDETSDRHFGTIEGEVFYSSDENVKFKGPAFRPIILNNLVPILTDYEEKSIGIGLVDTENDMYLASTSLESYSTPVDLPFSLFAPQGQFNDSVSYSYNSLKNIVYVFHNGVGLNEAQRIFESQLRGKNIQKDHIQKVWLSTKSYTDETKNFLRQSGMYPDQRLLKYYEPSDRPGA